MSISKLLTLMLVTGWILCLDQASKIYIHTQFQLGESVSVMEPYFHITSVRNYGAAFGSFAKADQSLRGLFFALLPPFALLLIVVLLRTVDSGQRLQVFGFSLIFAGALGNLIDRLRFGFVVDFIDLTLPIYGPFPAFNIADCAIVIGVGLAGFAILAQPEPTS